MVIVMAQGGQERLPLLGHPKHYLRVNDEPILGRMLRLVREEGYTGRIVVVGWPLPFSETFFGPFQAELRTLENPGFGLMNGVAQVRDLWGEEDTTFLLGDVVFSRRAIRTILSGFSEFRFFGRQGPNPVTGRPRGERFALQIGDLGRRKLDGYLLRRLVSGLDGFYRHVGGGYTTIDDWTDDIDLPEDLPLLETFSRLAREES